MTVSITLKRVIEYRFKIILNTFISVSGFARLILMTPSRKLKISTIFYFKLPLSNISEAANSVKNAASILDTDINLLSNSLAIVIREIKNVEQANELKLLTYIQINCINRSAAPTH